MLNHSLWADTYGPYQPTERLRESIDVDVAIVGGGLNGLSIAWHMRTCGEAIDVAVLERDHVGTGSNGRNAGVVMAQVGMHVPAVKTLYGLERAREAYEFGIRAVDYTRSLIADQHLDSDVSKNVGIMRIAMEEAWRPTLEATLAFYEDLGHGSDVEWVDPQTLRDELNSPLLSGIGGVFEPNAFYINPLKHVRELRRLAVDAGARVHEETPVVDVAAGSRRLVLRTPQGEVRANQVVFATNAYTHNLPGKLVRRGDQWPLNVYGLATAPLRPEQWDAIGWERRYEISNCLQSYHWMRPTLDGRIIFGGREMTPSDAGISQSFDQRILKRLEKDFLAFFPRLADLRITHRWGGVISTTVDLIPHLGAVAPGIFRITGCWGHGVATSSLHGRLFCDLLRGRTSELTEFWMVKREPRRWPPGPVRKLGTASVAASYKLRDELALRKARRRTSGDKQRAFAQLIS
jgi:glycine/D-amino acid oxidase-like deaminating enzyme